MRFEGKLWVFPDDDINTDLIFPGKYTYDPLTPEEMAQHAMEDYNSSFAQEVRSGDIVVTGKNFGCGSSREQAVICLKAAGVSCIIAKSYARIFYRNAINSALPLASSLECSDHVLTNPTKFENEKIIVDFQQGFIELQKIKFKFPRLDSQALKIFEAGGLVNFTKFRLRESFLI